MINPDYWKAMATEKLYVIVYIKHLNFEKITENVFPEYVIAVQSVADRNYEPMEKIIKLIF